MKPGVFLDRDGTINRDIGYLNHPDQFELIAGSAGAIRMLNEAGLPVVVITNQAGVAKGLIQAEQLPVLHEAFIRILTDEGAAIDGFYCCPHHPDGIIEQYTCTCQCRKPAPGLLRKASEELGIDLKNSYVVGDKISDVKLAHNVGATSVLVLTGHGHQQYSVYPDDCDPPHYIADNLHEAVQWILQQPNVTQSL